MKFKTILKNILFNPDRSYGKSLRSLQENYRWSKGNTSYSQEGEDQILDRFFSFQEDGFYVDIGAHHPHRFSNTHKFYEKGWRGVNVDAMPGSMRLFEKRRPKDINLEVGVDTEKSVAKFHIFNEPALNTFDEKIAKAHSNGDWKIERTELVDVLPLSEILTQHLPLGKEIDFLSVDVEGRDLNVLKSNDWDKYRPKMILVESLNSKLDNIDNDPTASYLRSKGYTVFAKTVNTYFFIREQNH